ncbi:unnamed protein product [Blepharisma stoltei]|uniref:Shugoshin C-terminal domain-containing protein n=1 Tax=Blepharisma stoltei TaxID=1481888 RepID=A0AAU9JZ38_9CILI|nr:unnamed protein product [Blepharisma stoltei]
MYREILNTFSPKDLKENISRFENMLSELSYCLEDLEIKRDELKSTNEMLKSAIEIFNSTKPGKPTASDHERSASLTLSTQCTEACETQMEDTDEASILKIKKFPSSPNKINSYPVSPFRTKRLSKVPSYEKVLHKGSTSLEQIQETNEEIKPQKNSIDIIEDVALPKQYFKSKTMAETRCTPYLPKRAPRYPRRSVKDNINS